MRRVIAGLVFVFCSPLFGYEEKIGELTQRLLERLPSEMTVAVLDFHDINGELTILGRFFADEVSVSLLNASAALRLFDRANLAALEEEVKLSEDGLVTPETAKQLELAGVDVLITGTITPLGSKVRLTLKAINTSSARVVTAANGDIELTKDLQALVSRTVRSGGSIGRGGSSQQAVLPGGRKVGPFEVALLDFKILGGGRLAVTFEVANTSGDERLVGIQPAKDAVTSITDERGHRLDFAEGLGVIYSWRVDGKNALSVPAGQANQFTLFFGPKKSLTERYFKPGYVRPGTERDKPVRSPEYGTRFTVTLSLATYDARHQRARNYAVSFRDVVVGK